jgi:hypothetical protein
MLNSCVVRFAPAEESRTGLGPEGPAASTRAAPVSQSTSPLEHWFLLTAIILVPLLEGVPLLGGVSGTWVLFFALGTYTVLRRTSAFVRVLRHPVLISLYLFLVVALLVELLHPYASLAGVLRTLQMGVGAALIGALCRDRKSLLVAIKAYTVGGALFSVLLVGTSYASFRSAAATSFNQIGHLRNRVLEQALGFLSLNPNEAAYYISQGLVATVALALFARSLSRRLLLLGISCFCLVGLSMALSRGGMVAAGIACLAVLLSRRKSWRSVLVLVAALAVTFYLFVPQVSLARFAKTSFTTKRGKEETRWALYRLVESKLPDHLQAGVGFGNFEQSWGLANGFAHPDPAATTKVIGAHNVWLQLLIYWGVPGLLAFSYFVWKVYACLPRRCGDDEIALALMGLGCSLLCQTLTTHSFYSKELALTVGLFLGAAIWYFPALQPAPRPQGRPG